MLQQILRNGTDIPRHAYQVWHEIRRGERTELPRFLNSLALIIARVSSSGLGFLTWLVIARIYDTNEVGIASGVTSAMMLAVQLALLGVGSAVISLFGRRQDRIRDVLHTSLTIVSGVSLLVAGVFLLLSSFLFQELSIVSVVPIYALMFMAISYFGTVNVLLDNVSIAMRRGDHVLTRNILFGVITIAAAVLLPGITGSADSMTIVLAWVLAGLAACLLGALQLWQSWLRYVYRPIVTADIGRELVQVGLPNYLLTLTERAPNWIIPIGVTELLSPVDNAHWYIVWMMAWVVFIVPISVGQNLFAEVARKPESIASAVRHSMRISFVLGTIAAVGIWILAGLLLSLLGESYAAAGTEPLRILVVSVIPITIIQAYYAICRATNRLLEATIAGVLNGSIGAVATISAGISSGLVGMAIAWSIVQILFSLWAFIRLRAAGLQASTQ